MLEAEITADQHSSETSCAVKFVNMESKQWTRLFDDMNREEMRAGHTVWSEAARD